MRDTPEPRRILIIENDDSMARLLASALRTACHRVTVCEDGRSGLAAALEGGTELVILDLMLDDPREGERVYARLTSDSRTADVPILVCTVHEPATVRRRLGGSPEHLLHKPFSIPSLLAMTRRVLGADA